MKTATKVQLSVILLILSALALAFLIGTPTDPSKAEFSREELLEAEKIGTEISYLMGQVSVDQTNCQTALTQIPGYLDRIAPLTDKLYTMDPDYLDKPDSRPITDLPLGVQWIQSKCESSSKS